MLKILADTSVWIEFFNNADSKWAHHLKELIDRDEVVLCGLVKCEILCGIRAEKTFKKVSEYLDGFESIDDSSDSVREKAVEIYRTCRKRGITIRTLVDCLIAASGLQGKAKIMAKDRDCIKIAELFPISQSQPE